MSISQSSDRRDSESIEVMKDFTLSAAILAVIELRGRMCQGREGFQLHERGRCFGEPRGRTDPATRALIHRRAGSSRARFVRAFVFLLHEFARDAGIDYVPRENLVVSAPAAGVKIRIDSRLANRRIQISVLLCRGFDHARDPSIT